MKYQLTLLLIVVSMSLTAQPNLDSLWGVWNDQTQPDTSRLKAVSDIAWDGYLFSQPDSAFYFAQLQYDLAEKNGLKKLMSSALNTQATSFLFRGNYPQALDYYQRALKIKEEMGDKLGIGSSMNGMGLIYKEQGNYAKALDHYQRGLKIYEEFGDEYRIAIILLNIGTIYDEQENYPKALDYYQRSLKTFEEVGDVKGIAGVLINAGSVYSIMGDYLKSLGYYQRCVKICEEIGDRNYLANALINMGTDYQKQGDYPQALDHLQRSLNVRQEIDDKLGIALSLLSIGLLYQEQGEHQKAIDQCKKSFELSKEIGSIDTQRKACECLYQAYKSLGNDQEALAQFEQAQALKDSLNETETAKKLQRFEFDKELLADSLRQEEEKHEIELAHQEEVAEKDKTRNMLMGGALLLLLVAGGLFSRNRYMNRSKKQIQKEKDRSEELLLNILPEEVAEELKDKGEAEAQLIDQVTVLFTDFKGFTAMSEQLSPKELVNDLNTCFSEFDRITAKYGIEKIKTIGDAYMAAGGLPTPNDTHATDVINAAMEMRDFVEAGKARKMDTGLPYFEIRIGVHTGPVVAGIVGVKKFQYDIWGDTVNTASRMESSGEVGQVNISEATYELVKDNSEFSFTSRGKVKAKGKGQLEMYFVARS